MVLRGQQEIENFPLAVQSGQTLHTRCLDCSFVSEYNNFALNSYAPVTLVKKMQNKLAQS